jgi:hypothetical protein
MALTKSQFITYLNCPMHLWAKVNKLEEKQERNYFREHLSKQGYKVEDLAEEFLKEKLKQYPTGSTIELQHKLNDGNYEAIVDVLIKDKKNNTVDIYEIKSSSHVKRSHSYGVTFQHILAKELLNINKTYLVHINSDYVKQGEIDLEQFFVITDMTDEILKHQDEVEVERANAKKLIGSKKPPENETCTKPKDCPCPSLCHYNLPKFSIYDIPDMRKKGVQFMTLQTMEIKDPTNIPSDFLLTTHQEKFLQSLRTKKPVIDRNAIKQQLDNLVYPLYFVDYETFGPAIPIYNNYKPYQNIVFQYSLHIVDEENNITHHEYIHTSKEEPSKTFIEDLLDKIGDKGTVISWYKPFENSRNKELAKLQPEYKKRLLDINSRTFDLMEIFKKQHYVDYRFRGSSSIKNVLPVLVPSLSYKDLNINKGDVAMLKWYEAVFGEDKDKEQTIKDLLEYCKLDTWAMVEIWRKLKNLN